MSSNRRYAWCVHLLVIVLAAASAFAAPGTTGKMSTPSLGLSDATPSSIYLTVTAGSTGAPGGFSIQWISLSDYLSYGWPVDSDCALGCAASYCKGSFSGNANLSRYNLKANESVTVNVGEFLFDNGASTSCGEQLECGTTYVFRAFAHANSSLFRSDFTSDFQASTDACEGNGCTYTQGYWKTHGPVPVGNNSNMWPVTSLMLGNNSYTDLELLAIFNQPAAGNGLIALAHQLMAAKLNIANGASSSAIASTIAAADALIANKVVPPVGAGSLSPGSTSALINTLTHYNEGDLDVPHCP